MTRTYAELSLYESFKGRFEYLMTNSKVGAATFGYERYLNQRFYRSAEWKRIRQQVIARDNGCDLGVPGYEIHDKIIVHHMNPIEAKDILEVDFSMLDPRYLICCSLPTHNAIHYGDKEHGEYLAQIPTVRTQNDTKLW